MKFLRDFLERVLFVGLSTGLKPVDPLYLTNRTWKQKLKPASLLCLPLLAVAILASVYMFPRTAKTPAQPVSVGKGAELSLSKLEVVEVSVQKNVDPPVITGTVRNTSDTQTESAEITFDITDQGGSRVEAVSTRVQNLQPHGTAAFRIPISQKSGELVLVRELRRL